MPLPSANVAALSGGISEDEAFASALAASAADVHQSNSDVPTAGYCDNSLPYLYSHTLPPQVQVVSLR